MIEKLISQEQFNKSANYFAQNRALWAAFGCSQHILRAVDEKTLLQDICQLLTDVTHYSHAWIELTSEDSAKESVPAAWSGKDEGNLRTIQIAWDETRADFNIHDSRDNSYWLTTARNILIHPAIEDWRVPARSPKYSNSLTIPIRYQDATIGELHITLNEGEIFDEGESRILEEMAGELAYGIITLRQKKGTLTPGLNRPPGGEIRRINRRVEKIIESSPEALILLNSVGSLDKGNKAFYELTGFEENMIFRQSPEILGTADSREEIRMALDTAITHCEIMRFETIAAKKNGSEFACEFAFSPILEAGSLKGFVCSLRDISDYKEVNRLKDAFVSNVSHELRTPISSLKVNHRMITLDPDNSARYMNRLGREINRLDDLIQGLLLLSRLDRSEKFFDFKPVALNSLIGALIEDRRSIINNKKLIIRFIPKENLPLVRGNAALIEQTLSIFLTNSMNYTPADGEISIEALSLESDEGNWAGFSIRDTGPGIVLNEQHKLFDRFYRGKAGHESGVPGTGLGLAIAKEIILKHGGWIELESQGIPGQGTTFIVYLPVAER